MKTWLTQHKLALNDKKTEAIRITTVSTCHPRPAVIHVGALAVLSKPHVRDIGIVLDDTMTMGRPKHVLSPSQYSQYKTFADYLCIQDNSPQPRRVAPGLWKCYSVRHFRIPSPQTSGLAELCCTVDNRNPPTGAHFTSHVCTALVTHSPAHQIQTAATRLSLSPPTGSCIPIRTHHTIHCGKVPAIGR